MSIEGELCVVNCLLKTNCVLSIVSIEDEFTNKGFPFYLLRYTDFRVSVKIGMS